MIAAESAQQIKLVRQILPLAAAILIFAVTVELIRRRRLREEYALLWLLASVVLLVVAVFPRLFLSVSKALDIDYRTMVMLIGFSFLSLMIIHLSVVASRNVDDSRNVAQRVALLEDRLEKVRPPGNEDPPEPQADEDG